jgi:purine-binding chemotaxis protein CheW
MARSPGARKRTPKKSGEQPLVPEVVTAPEAFPDDSPPAAEQSAPPVSGAAGRIELPPSGLAADILMREEAKDIAVIPQEAPAAVAPTPQHSHSLSFFTMPSREEKKVVEPMEHLVTFYLGHEEYALDVRLVQEIIRVAETTPVPRAPDFVKGVINLRGRIIPVVDLKRKLGLGEVDGSLRTARIVVIKLRDRLVGLLVDGASQVLKVPVSTIEQAPEEVLEVNANYIRGVAKLQDRLIILMDLTQILMADVREVGAQALPA